MGTSSRETLSFLYRVVVVIQDQLMPLPYTLTYVGFAVRMLQLLSFVVNPFFSFDFRFLKQLTEFIFIFSAPLFDRTYGPFNAFAYFFIIVFFVVLLLIGIFFFILNFSKPEMREYQSVLQYMRLLVESVVGFLFVPLMHLFLGMLRCHDGVLINFPDTTCGSSLHIAAYFFSIVGILLLVTIALVGCLFFDPDPHSHHLLARPHGYIDFLTVIILLVGTILFHLLVYQGSKTAYSIIMLVLSATGFLAHILIIPYYNMRVLSVCTGTYLAVFVVAFVNCLTYFEVSVLNPSSDVLTCTIVFSVLPVTFVFGYLLGTLRVSSDMLHKLHILFYYGYSPEHVALLPFPRTFVAPRRSVPETVISVYNDIKLQVDLEEQGTAKHGQSSTNRDTLPHQFEFFVPFISNAYFPTDSEVATRFLRELHSKVGMMMEYTSAQLLFALEIYIKAIVYFRQSPYAFASLGWYLYFYSNRLPAALDLLNHIKSRSNFLADFMVQYKLHHLEYLVKEGLGYREDTYHRALQKAHFLHCCALKEMVALWDGLTKNVDTVSLFGMTNRLARFREKAFQEYNLALISSKDDRVSLDKLVEFIDHVLHQDKNASELRSAITEMELEKKSKALLEVHMSQQIRRNQRYIKIRDVREACEHEQGGQTAQHGRERWIFFGFLYYCVFCAVGLTAGMLASFIVGEKYAHHCIARQSDIFRAQAAGYAAMYYSEVLALYTKETNCKENTGGCISDLNFVQHKLQVSSAEQEMRMRQNSATFGANKLSLDSHGFNFAAKGYIPMRFFTVGSSSFSGLFGTPDESNLILYAKLTTTLFSVSTPTVEWIGGSTTSAYITSFINCAQKSLDCSHYLEFITDGGVSVFLYAMNPFSDAVNVDLHSKKEFTILLGSILAFLAIIHVVFLVFARYTVSAWSIRNHIVLLQLLRKVPLAAAEDLRTSHAAILDEFQKSANAKAEEVDLPSDEFSEVSAPYKASRRGTSINALKATILTVLQSKPGKGCLKQAPGGNFREKRTVRFCLTQSDLVERSRHQLKEPGISINGSKSQVVQEFEDQLKKIDIELEEEKLIEQERRDTYTSQLISAGYRFQWRKIREKIASWRHSDLSSFGLVSIVFAIVALLLAIAVIVLLFLTLSVHNDLVDYEISSLSQLKSVYNYVAAFDESDIKVSSFCNFFYAKYASDFIQYAFVDEDYQSLPRDLQNKYDPEVLRFVTNTEALFIAVLHLVISNMIYVALAARAGYGLNEFDLPSYTYLNNFKWGRQESDLSFLLQMYPSALESPDDYIIPPLDSYTLPNDPAEFFSTILPYHRRKRFYADADRVRSALTLASENIKELSLENNDDKTSRLNYYYIAIYICSAVFFCICITGVLLFRVTHYGGAPITFLSLAAVCSAVCFVLTLCLLKIKQDSGDYLQTSQEDLESIGQFRTFFYRRTTLIEQYFYSTDLTYLKSILEYKPDFISSYLQSAVKRSPSIANSVANILLIDTEYWVIQQVSLYLGYSARKLASNPTEVPVPPSPPFLSTYNYKTEANYVRDSALYGSDHPDLMYSTPEVDLKKSSSELFDMARFAIFGLRGTSYFFDCNNQLDELIEAVTSESLSDVNSMDLKLNILNKISLCFAFLMLFFLLCAASIPAVRVMRGLIEGPDVETVWEAFRIEGRQQAKRIIFVCISVGVIIMLTFILCVIPVTQFGELSTISRYSALRIAAVQKSMARAVYYNYALQSDSFALALSTITDLESAIDNLTDARSYLYMADHASKSIFGTFTTFSAAQRALLFTPVDGSTTVDNVYTDWIATLQKLVIFNPTAEVVTPNIAAVMKNLYSVSKTDKDQVNQWVSSLESQYSLLIKSLKASDDLFEGEVASTFTKVIIPVCILSLLGEILLIGAAVFAVRNVLKSEKNSVKDIRPVFTAIPKGVIDCVPALSIYADSGIVEKEEGEVGTNVGLSEQGKAFLAFWRNLEEDDTEFDQSYKELEANSHPCLLSSQDGCIMFANTAALNLFKHESLKGKNISVLMHQGAAEVHSRLMAFYMAHREEKNFQPSKIHVQAYTKNLDSVNVVIVLMEAPVANENLYFLAEMYPQTGGRKIAKK